MASMKHLKQALKGTQKRLERAEALLRMAEQALEDEFCLSNRSDIVAKQNKIKEYFNEAIDSALD